MKHTISYLIRRARLETGMSQTELAMRVGTRRYNIVRLEEPQEGSPVPPIQFVAKVLEAMGYRMDIRIRKVK